jgi:hypothetical protein
MCELQKPTETRRGRVSNVLLNDVKNDGTWSEPILALLANMVETVVSNHGPIKRMETAAFAYTVVKYGITIMCIFIMKNGTYVKAVLGDVIPYHETPSNYDEYDELDQAFGGCFEGHLVSTTEANFGFSLKLSLCVCKNCTHEFFYECDRKTTSVQIQEIGCGDGIFKIMEYKTYCKLVGIYQ